MTRMHNSQATRHSNPKPYIPDQEACGSHPTACILSRLDRAGRELLRDYVSPGKVAVYVRD